ncbi:hypothetical protein HDU93_000603 [Gonapodya sp. JEL0774]|nr:hypothetical protein HDU93_000603 [Gonapodya sp. JEL0774]
MERTQQPGDPGGGSDRRLSRGGSSSKNLQAVKMVDNTEDPLTRGKLRIKTEVEVVILSDSDEEHFSPPFSLRPPRNLSLLSTPTSPARHPRGLNSSEPYPEPSSRHRSSPTLPPSSSPARPPYGAREPELDVGRFDILSSLPSSQSLQTVLSTHPEDATTEGSLGLAAGQNRDGQSRADDIPVVQIIVQDQEQASKPLDDAAKAADDFGAYTGADVMEDLQMGPIVLFRLQSDKPNDPTELSGPIATPSAVRSRKSFSSPITPLSGSAQVVDLRLGDECVEDEAFRDIDMKQADPLDVEDTALSLQAQLYGFDAMPDSQYSAATDDLPPSQPRSGVLFITETELSQQLSHEPGESAQRHQSWSSFSTIPPTQMALDEATSSQHAVCVPEVPETQFSVVAVSEVERSMESEPKDSLHYTTEFSVIVPGTLSQQPTQPDPELWDGFKTIPETQFSTSIEKSEGSHAGNHFLQPQGDSPRASGYSPPDLSLFPPGYEPTKFALDRSTLSLVRDWEDAGGECDGSDGTEQHLEGAQKSKQSY